MAKEKGIFIEALKEVLTPKNIWKQLKRDNETLLVSPATRRIIIARHMREDKEELERKKK